MIILSVFGKIIKWFFLFAALDFIGLVIYFAIEKSTVDGIGYGVLIAALFGLFAFAGDRMEKLGKGKKKPAAGKSDSTASPPPPKEPAAKLEYKPVIRRDARVSDGQLIYGFIIDEDSFANREEPADRELSWDFWVAANLGKHILDYGGSIRGIYIGGGVDEVSHTGAVAYAKGYSSLESFVQNCMRDMDDAHDEASAQYGVWFSSLNFNFIIIDAQIGGMDIEVDVGRYAASVTVRIPLGMGSEGFVYLAELVRRFGEKGVGADELFWDDSLKVLRRTFQLEETRTYFWTSYMDVEGVVTKYSLDVETADDSHYEILPRKVERMTGLLKEQTKKVYLPGPEVGCAYYLQLHSGLALITLLKEHGLIAQEFHYD